MFLQQICLIRRAGAAGGNPRIQPRIFPSCFSITFVTWQSASPNPSALRIEGFPQDGEVIPSTNTRKEDGRMNASELVAEVRKWSSDEQFSFFLLFVSLLGVGDKELMTSVILALIHTLDTIRRATGEAGQIRTWVRDLFEKNPTLKPKEVAQMVADHFSLQERWEDTLTGILGKKARPRSRSPRGRR